jgi:2-aminobenzoate-CoA ligase
MDEMTTCAKTSKFLKTVVGFDGTSNHDAELDRLALEKPVQFNAVETSQDDVALLGFTSGTTGDPKATMHFHRDLLIIADGYAREVLGVTPDDVFVGSPPLAFTFGLGGLAVFPLRFGAAATLLETASPPNMIEIIEKFKATVCFTAPTAYRAMLQAMDEGADLSSLRAAVSAGETLPALAVRGPTGCRYLADDRQKVYVQDGWNITGDSFTMDADGYLHFAARNDDMIISAGYNIAGPEVEAALLSHPAVSECGVVGAPDEARGAIVQAHVVLVDGVTGDDALVKELQDHVKNTIAPYKYPRDIKFIDALPKTATGKIQRFALRGKA